MKKYTKTILVILLTISIGLNLVNYKYLLESQEKIKRVNTIVASNVESGIRQSMMYMQELIDTEAPESLQGLERSLGNLALAFNHWVDLNQSSKKPNEKMQKTLSSIEMMRNTITHSLSNQYKRMGNQLTDYDIEMLKSTNQQLNKLLLVYHNIEDRLFQLKDPLASDGGLGQIANNIEEINRLYRHSKIPNKHPQYIEYHDGEAAALEVFPFLEDYKIKEEKEKVMLKDGVHYYEYQYYDGQDPIYTVWIDATDGKVRNFELKRIPKNKKDISQNEAINIARNFVHKFYNGQLKEEMFYIEGTEKTAEVYSFRFTPIIGDIQIVSDAYIVNIAASSGEVLKYTNDFTGTVLPDRKTYSPVEEIIEKYKEEYGEMKYNGLAIVRSFYTHYQPRLVHSFRIIQNKEENMVFFDVETGTQVYQLYYVYHPIFN